MRNYYYQPHERIQHAAAGPATSPPLCASYRKIDNPTMTIEKLFHIDTLTNELNSHLLKSGEVILQFDQIKTHPKNLKDIIETFFEINSIKTVTKQFDIVEISKDEAINSIIYGLSIKPNYTLIATPFTKSGQNKFAFNFVQLFDNPTFYSVNTRLYKTDLNLGDFWESGGAFGIDKNMIGLFWINDLYDKY